MYMQAWQEQQEQQEQQEEQQQQRMGKGTMNENELSKRSDCRFTYSCICVSDMKKGKSCQH
jgi:hypothetical protein